MEKYTLIDYNDVWGNENEGYTINDVMRYENYLDIAENASEEDIIKALVEKGYLLENTEYEVYASDDMLVEIFSNDYPICALVKEE